ncbi:PREDICTED: metabotropic glutamate receptor 3-like [Amphimedon queenslandica]|uniref:G-protein coupled receptors family 3 profile domain-containing protein n=2 Tax=Amphimedon queenslandica TaxID=400682 RepID=A0AAN0IF10_AMPQE|nr:PREDICTED: metabotropic glutamate receptor 3-like [Amphimedon queenslandica]|eukprot:XP_003387246.2 PREDICTED: metabotropic glutamate receptor 3-like [Amphimedon queenslandica]
MHNKLDVCHYFTRMICQLTLLFLLTSLPPKTLGIQYQYESQPVILKSDGDTRISGIQDRIGKDIVLGGLFTVYYSSGGTGVGSCGDEIWEDGMEMLEAMLFAIDSVNSDPTLLPNLTLGYDIRDTCKRENVAMDETIDIVLSSGDLELESCAVVNTSTSEQVPVSVIIGAFESFITTPMAGLLRLFQKSQISYGSSSTALSNRELYSYFFRTFPPDDKQAQAMVDLIVHYGWDHISTINSNNLYGQRGIEEVKKHAAASSICIDFDAIITDEFKIADYANLASELLNSSANVVVLFASVHHVRSLFTELDRIQTLNSNERRFVWIASDTWAELTDREFNNVTAGKFGFAAFSENLDSFDVYYSQLLPSTNKRNPWFPPYYEQYHKCKIDGIPVCDNTSVTNTSEYKQFSVVPLVMDAVYAAAHAIDNFIQDNCDQPVQWYPGNQSCRGYNQSLNGDVLFRYISKVNFTSPSNNMVNFDSLGNIAVAKYSIFNYQLIKCTSNDCPPLSLVNIGTWDSSVSNNRLQLYPNVRSQFGITSSGEGEYMPVLTLKSQCQVCSPGHIKRIVVSSCCGTCDPCLGQNYTNASLTNTSCQTCPSDMWGNNPLTGSTGCVDISHSYLKPTDAWGIVLIVLSAVGLIAVVFVTCAFIWFWNTPIVKSSGREQMILLLIGLTLCFLVTIVFLLKPSPVSCGFQRVGLWFCFSLVLSALLVKLIRISRIFLHKSISNRPKYTGSIHQILFTFLLVGVQMSFVLVSMIVVHPDTITSTKLDENNHNDYPTLILKCTSPHIALIILQMLYFSALLIASNALAVLTIRFPANFNESKYVSFSTFSLGLMWFLFILSYIATNDSTIQTAVISSTIQLSALAVLFCLFGPRVVIMIFWPQQNVLETAMPTQPTLLNSFPKADHKDGGSINLAKRTV